MLTSRSTSLLLASRRGALLARQSKAIQPHTIGIRCVSSSNPKKVDVRSVIEADTGTVGTKFYHMSSTALLVAAPLALFLSPSPIVFPLDLILGVAFPIHGHIGFNYIITDYVPKASRPLARYILLGATGITILGLLKLNLTGPGLTETYKSLWRAKPEEK